MTNVSRKTSGRYHLVYFDNDKVTTITCDPLTGAILTPIGKKKSGANLETLDIYILENFKNKEELMTHLKDLGYPVSTRGICYFSYQHNGATKYLDLIYHSEELHDLALLCQKYKKHFSDYAMRNKISSKELRRVVSKQIRREALWKDFYSSLLSYIHDPDFYSHLIKKDLFGKRILGFIHEYLKSENYSYQDQQEAFCLAKNNLIDTFTTYKPIRGMIISRNNYIKSRLKQEVINDCGRNLSEEKANDFGYTNPMDLISESQFLYLEAHPYFDNLSKEEREDFILSILGLTKVPWYERTIFPISKELIAILEAQSKFLKLTYLEKIRYVNELLASQIDLEKESSFYQKKKV